VAADTAVSADSGGKNESGKNESGGGSDGSDDEGKGATAAASSSDGDCDGAAARRRRRSCSGAESMEGSSGGVGWVRRLRRTGSRRVASNVRGAGKQGSKGRHT
jgi:hypothetical protein